MLQQEGKQEAEDGPVRNDLRRMARQGIRLLLDDARATQRVPNEGTKGGPSHGVRRTATATTTGTDATDGTATTTTTTTTTTDSSSSSSSSSSSTNGRCAS
jgi:hypothetical protein